MTTSTTAKTKVQIQQERIDQLISVAKEYLPLDQIDGKRQVQKNKKGALYISFSVNDVDQRMYYFANEKAGNPEIVLSTMTAEGKVDFSQRFLTGTEYTYAHMTVWFAQQRDQIVKTNSRVEEEASVPVEENTVATEEESTSDNVPVVAESKVKVSPAELVAVPAA